MKVRKYLWPVSVLLVLLLLAGCGGASKDAAMEAPMMQNSMADYAVEETAPAAGALTEESSTQSQVPDSRKWIITVDMSAETEDMDALLDAVQQQIDQLGGYVQNQRVSNGSRYSNYRYRSASLTVRVPADQVDAFTEKVGGLSNVVRSSKSLEDITLSYVATESRMNALKTEEARLLELMAKAENMSDLLEIEARLTDVRYELERVTSQLRTYDNQVNYATIYLTIEEVTEYTPVEEETLWQRISGGFLRSLKGVGSGLLNFGVWILVNIPYFVVIAGIVWLLWKLIVLLRKRRASRPPRNKQKNASPYMPQDPPQERNPE